jgi:hypothetical protein
MWRLATAGRCGDEFWQRDWSSEEWTARVKRALRDGEVRLFECGGERIYGLVDGPLPAGAKLLPASRLVVAARPPRPSSDVTPARRDYDLPVRAACRRS